MPEHNHRESTRDRSGPDDEDALHEAATVAVVASMAATATVLAALQDAPAVSTFAEAVHDHVEIVPMHWEDPVAFVLLWLVVFAGVAGLLLVMMAYHSGREAR